MAGDIWTPGYVFSDLYGWQAKDPPAPIIQTQGCICPPTSEKTCENPACPRQNPFKPNKK